MKRILSVIIALTALFSLTVIPSCTDSRLYSEGEGEISVVCTVFPIFDFARNVGGDKAAVTLLQDSGADMHSYSPTAAALKAVGDADIFLCIGGETESTWIDGMIASSENKDLKVIKMSSVIEEKLFPETSCDWSQEHQHEHQGGFDEHFWTSIENAEEMAEAICLALCEINPENALYYCENTERYTDKLDILDSDYESAFKNAKSELLIFADRFPFVYLMHDYLFSYLAAFGGCSTETDASYETLSKICTAVQNNGITAVLTIDGSDKKLANSVKEQTGCDILTLNSLQSVTRSELEAGINYIDVMTENLSVLRTALGTR